MTLDIKMGNTREAFGLELLELAREGYNVFGIGADTSKSMGVDLLKKEFPHRIFDVGIAEQNLIMTAAGLASDDKIVFATSYSAFTSMRCIEQFRSFAAYPNLNVKIIAGLGGFTAGIEGVTHTALEDLGIVRCLPNVCVINPADAVATRKAVRAAALHEGPVYIRVGRDASPLLFDMETYRFEIGKANVLFDDGNDVALLATGFPLYEAMEAYKQLKSEGIRMKLIDVPTLKPLDGRTIIEVAGATGAIVTVEEHYYTGGLGSAVAEVTARECPTPLEQVAVEDKYTQSGYPEELREKYGLTVPAIVAAVKKVMKRKKA